ncbi:MAG: 30S ribosomal protein S11 [Candidatus Aenigmarchaeota archaeon ex4484_56]|nr:MAG: 30S ribosomal protein S11 [Candidatus Aenigmarchaeota archaeon ex4484_56]
MINEGMRGIVRIYSSKNNTIVHITDITGAETISRVSGGMITKQDRLKGAAFQGMLAAQKAAEEAKERGVTSVDILVRAPGGHKSMNVGKGAEPAIKAIVKSGLKVNVIEDVTPVIHGYMRRKGGRRGRRL